MVSARMLFCGLLAVALSSAHAHVAVRGSRAFLEAGMQPEVVARTLKNVEEEWKAQAAVFAQCNATASDGSSIVDCQDAPASFAKSCGVVVGAIVQGSNGDQRVAKEYMTDVCDQSVLTGWHKKHCFGLAQSVNGAMTADTYVNRNSFDSKKLCTNFWSTFLKREQERLAEEKAAREAAEKKAAEEEKAAREAAEKKAQEEAAEAAKKAEEMRKAEEARKKIEQAAKQKAEAEAKAKAAAEKLAKKKAEAEAVAKAAQQKIDEAKQAEKEHKEALEKLQANQTAPVEKIEKQSEKQVSAEQKQIDTTPAVTAPETKTSDAKAAVAAVEPKKPDAKPAVATQAKSDEKPAPVVVASVKEPVPVEKANSTANSTAPTK